MTAFRLFVITVFIILVSACTGTNSHAPVPRPVAYPRVAELDSSFVALDSLPLYIEVNRSAKVRRSGDFWLDIIYPDYGAVVYVTLTSTRVDSIGSVIANRRERISLNIADAANTTYTEITSPDFSSALVYSPMSHATPLQFLASDNEKWVVSGAVFFRNVRPDAPSDSLRPMVETIRRDLVHTLSTLTHRQ